MKRIFRERKADGKSKNVRRRVEVIEALDAKGRALWVRKSGAEFLQRFEVSGLAEYAAS
jgi:hypothetical protein